MKLEWSQNRIEYRFSKFQLSQDRKFFILSYSRDFSRELYPTSEKVFQELYSAVECSFESLILFYSLQKDILLSLYSIQFQNTLRNFFSNFVFFAISRSKNHLFAQFFFQEQLLVSTKNFTILKKILFYSRVENFLFYLTSESFLEDFILLYDSRERTLLNSTTKIFLLY